MEKNRIEFTGTVEMLRKITTKSGGTMAKWLLLVGNHRFGCVAFKNVAQAVLGAGDGAKIGIVGTGAINSWKTDDGAWRNDFQVSCWTVELENGETVHFEKSNQAGQQEPSRSDVIPNYAGGPF